MQRPPPTNGPRNQRPTKPFATGKATKAPIHRSSAARRSRVSKCGGDGFRPAGRALAADNSKRGPPKATGHSPHGSSRNRDRWEIRLAFRHLCAHGVSRDSGAEPKGTNHLLAASCSGPVAELDLLRKVTAFVVATCNERRRPMRGKDPLGGNAAPALGMIYVGVCRYLSEARACDAGSN